jgi:ATP-dependent helicase HrpA
MAGTELPLGYRFAPGQPNDGLTLTVPLALLNQVDPARLSWLVPGLVREKLTVLLKALPKALRNRLTPLPDAVTAFLEATPSGPEALPDALRRWLVVRLGEAPPADLWDGTAIPAHLRIRIRVVDAGGGELASGRDLAELRAQLGEAAQLSFAQAGPALERRGIKAWNFGALPETLTTVAHGQRLTGYPALVDDADSVSIALLDTQAAADASTRAGVVRLLRIALKSSLAAYEKGGTGFAHAAMQLKTTIPTERLLADALAAVCDRAFVGDDPLPRSEPAFAAQLRRARARLPAVAEGAFRLLADIAAAHHALGQRIGASPPALARPVAAVRRRRDALVYPGFFRSTPWAQMAHLPRYLTALDRRLVKFPENPARDARHSDTIEKWWERYNERRGGKFATADAEAALENFRWSLEELSVSLFAQELKTPFPVSLKRLEKAWAGIGR